ncbi:ferredoxin [Terrisporobacter sp.]|uniref:ferredoxin n=1 Tax=Terrisporobacter sp. TaxID=1965305 RepID=UPI00263543AA|nr:ferredoxin [Terrisporobacter sp.]
MKAKVDRDICIGCGACESNCPEVFELDDESISIVIVNKIPEALEVGTLDAEEGCPVNAISIE